MARERRFPLVAWEVTVVLAAFVVAGLAAKRGGSGAREEDEDLEDADVEFPDGELGECDICHGELLPLGQLGSALWFRCRACGATQPA